VVPKWRDGNNRFLDRGDRLCFDSIDGADGVAHWLDSRFQPTLRDIKSFRGCR
jgi:hypothetical protein